MKNSVNAFNNITLFIAQAAMAFFPSNVSTLTLVQLTPTVKKTR
jgi:hypothetical protein